VIELKNIIPQFLTLYMMKLYIEKLRSKTITNIEVVFFSFCPVLVYCILMQNIGVFQTLVTEQGVCLISNVAQEDVLFGLCSDLFSIWCTFPIFS